MNAEERGGDSGLDSWDMTIFLTAGSLLGAEFAPGMVFNNDVISVCCSLRSLQDTFLKRISNDKAKRV